MANDKTMRAVYDDMAARYSNIGTWEDFNGRMNNESSRRAVYNDMTKRYSNMGSWEEFNARLGYQSPPPTAAAPTVVTPAVEAPTPAPPAPAVEAPIAPPAVAEPAAAAAEAPPAPAVPSAPPQVEATAAPPASTPAEAPDPSLPAAAAAEAPATTAAPPQTTQPTPTATAPAAPAKPKTPPQAAAPAPATPVYTPASPAASSPLQFHEAASPLQGYQTATQRSAQSILGSKTFYRFRQGGRDFSVSREAVNAAGGLQKWAEQWADKHPGSAPLRVYISGTDPGGRRWDGHVDMQSAARRELQGFSYTLSDASGRRVDEPDGYYHFRRGGKNFSVPTSVVEASGGLDEFAERYRGAPLQVFMTSNDDRLVVVDARQVKNRMQDDYQPAISPDAAPLSGMKLTRTAAPAAGSGESRRIARLEAQRREVEAQIAARKREIGNSTPSYDLDAITMTAMASDPMVSGASFSSPFVRIQSDPEYRALQARLKTIEKSLLTLQRSRQFDIDDSGFLTRFAYGVKDGVSDWSNWTGGLSDVPDMLTLNSINNKIGRGQQLTESEQGLMQSLYGRQLTESLYGDMGNGYTWGGIAGMSIPFMAQMFVTGGFSALSGASTRAATWALTRAGGGALVQKIGSCVATRAVADRLAQRGLMTFLKNEGLAGLGGYIKEGAARWAVKSVGTTLDVVARGAVQTAVTQSGGVVADAVKNKLGAVEEGPDGQLRFENNMSWGRAAFESIADRTIENSSEMVGGFMPGLKAIGRYVGLRNVEAAVLRGGRKIGSNKLGTAWKYTTWLLEKAGMHGFFEEVGEEYVGQFGRTALGLQTALDENGRNLLFSGKFHGDIWGGMMMSVGMTSVATSVAVLGGRKAYDYTQRTFNLRRANTAASTALGEDRWAPMRDRIESTTNADMGRLYEEYDGDASLSNEQKLAVQEFMNRTMINRGGNLRDIVDALYGGLPMSPADVARLEGSQTTDPQARRDVALELKDALREFGTRFGVNTDNFNFNVNTDDFNKNFESLLREAWKTNGKWTAEQRSAYFYLEVAYSRMAGLKKSIDIRIDEEDHADYMQWRQRSNPADGTLREATLTSGGKVWIRKGNVVTDANGVVDASQSDATVEVYDESTGTTVMIAPTDLATAQAPVSITDVLEPLRRQRRAGADAERDAFLNGQRVTADLTPGSKIKTQGLGYVQEGTVLGPVSVPGSQAEWTNIQYPDGRIVARPNDELQREAQEIADREEMDDYLGRRGNVTVDEEEETNDPEDQTPDPATEADPEGQTPEAAAEAEDAQEAPITEEAPAEEPSVPAAEEELVSEKEVPAAEEEPVSEEDPATHPDRYEIEDEVELPDGSTLTVVGIHDDNPADPAYDVEITYPDGRTRVLRMTAAEITARAAKEAPAATPSNEAPAPEANQETEATETLTESTPAETDTPIEEADETAADDSSAPATPAISQEELTEASTEETPEPVSDQTTAEEESAAPAQATEESDISSETPLSDETDEFGKPFVKATDGTITFGHIDAESMLAPLPIRLSLGENTEDERGNNHGYGLLHIVAGHGQQILNAGYSSIEEFVEYVARNYTDIREGAIVANNQTYLLEVSDKHNNTLFIQLSRDGSYWNVNSAGIFRKKYSRSKTEVYTRPAVGDGTVTDTNEVNSGQDKGETAPAGNSSTTSAGEVTKSSADKQAPEVESSEKDGNSAASRKETLVEQAERIAAEAEAKENKPVSYEKAVDAVRAVVGRLKKGGSDTSAVFEEMARAMDALPDDAFADPKGLLAALTEGLNLDAGKVWSVRTALEETWRKRPGLVEERRAELETRQEGALDNIKPVGYGDFGPIFTQFRGNLKGAIKLLSELQFGEAIGALHHNDIGEIDLVWGKTGTGHSDGFGLAKLLQFHPEVVENLQEILDDMHIVSRSANRINLESNTHKAAVRLTWNNEQKKWLLTAFDKKETSASIDKTTDTDDSPLDLRGDTALSQNADVSNGEVTQSPADKQAPETENSPKPAPTNPEGKAWAEMDAEERLAVAEASPLTTDEIDSADVDKTIKNGARAFLEGRCGPINTAFYLNLYQHVRITDNNSAAGSGNASGESLVAGPDSGWSDRRRDRRQSGDARRSVDPKGSDTDVSAAPDGGPYSERDSAANDGVRSDRGVSRRKSAVERDGGGNADTSRSGNAGRDGVSGRRNAPGGSRGDADIHAGRSSDARPGDNGTDAGGDWTDAAISNFLKDIKDFLSGSDSSLSVSLVGLNNRQLEMLPRVICSGLRAGYALIHRGYRKFAQWAVEMHAIIDGPMMGAGFTEAELDGWIAEMWEADFEVDGVSRPLSQWAAEMSRQELRAKVRLTLEEKARLQRLAEDIPVELCSRENISATLPYLLPQQLDDVLRAETQFFDPSHADREHGFGKGYMFTNGTGTGKTYTGLGIAKRFIKQGRGRVLILTPSQQKVTDWAHDAANLGIDLRSLDDWAKQRGTTATTEKGEGAVVTTYANFRQNQALLEDEFDLIIYDESHRILENKTATQTAGAVQHYRISNKDEGWAVSRMTHANPLWQQWKRLEGEIQAEYTRLRSQARERLGDGVLDSQLVTAGHIPPPPHAAWKETDKAKWPKIHAAIEATAAAAERFNNEELPDIREKAAASVGRTKVVFLSATPFNTLHSLAYAEGYIFSYPESNSARMSAQSQFMLEHFGAAFRFRYGQLQRRAENPEAVARQEVAFSDWLQHTLGTLSGRLIDSEYDYSRHFPTVTGSYAERFNQAMEALSRDKATHAAYQKVMTYGYKTALFESLKAAQIVDRIKAHIDQGRKIVIFHRRMETKEPLRPPFAAILSAAAAAAQKELNPAKRAESLARIAELKTEFTDMLRWEQTIDLRMPREIIADAFGADRVLFFSGKETAKAKNKAVTDFNSDDSGKNIIVIQEASGKEGISLHDTTGNHQRVLITLALPESPITALQIEGRIYRIGGRSNAIFEYPLLGIDEELNTFGQKFNTAVGTTENLALGSKARNLRDSFARGVEEYSGDVDVPSQGTGGKELDGSMDGKELDPFEAAVLDYYGNRKLSGRRSEREGADFYPTPEPLGYMMTQWGRIAEGESVLEPSAGHGAIARYVPQSAALTAIEPSMKLFARLQLRAGGVGRRFESMMFEDYNTVNKHDVVVMNPPFGTAGRLAVDHVAKAFQHLEDGGRIVALIPRGSTDAKFDKWYAGQKDALMVGEVALPSITFEQAGTAVNCRVVVIDKIRSYALRERAASSAVHVDLARRFGKIEEFFEAIRDIRMPERTIDAAQQSRKKALPAARDLRQVKGVRDVRLMSDGISVDFRGGFATMAWNDRSGDNLRKWALNEFRKYAEAADMSRRSERETRAIVMEEMAALAAKLAGMSVEEAANATGVTLPEAPATPSDSEVRFRRGNKKTPVTGLPNRANEKQTSGSVPSSISGNSSSNRAASKKATAKLQKRTQSTKRKIKEYSNKDFNVSVESLNATLTDLGKLLSMDTKGGSRYAVLRTDGGQTVAVRLSDHAANGNNFAADNADKNISIVIERRVFDGKQSQIRYTEATIPMSAYEADPQAVVAAIVRGVEDVLADKPFTLDQSIGKVEEKGSDSTAADARFSVGEDRGRGDHGAVAHEAVVECLRRCGIEVVTVTREQALAKAAAEGVNMLETEDGTVYGWTEGGRIYLTEDGLDAETLVHEYTHLWVAAMQKSSPKAWASIVKMLKGTSEWKAVEADPLYANIRGNVDEVASEVLSRLSGAKGRERFEAEARRQIEAAKGVIEKAQVIATIDSIRRAVRGFWSWVGQNLFGIKRFRSVDEITDRVLYDLTRGTRLDKGQKDASLVGTHSITVDKIRSAIKRGGLANPSVAVVDVERQPETMNSLNRDYGEITLILPSTKINKGGSGSGGTFTGDAWTPVYPAISIHFSDKGVRNIRRDMKDFPEEIRRSIEYAIYESGYTGAHQLDQNAGLMYWYLSETGQLDVIDKSNRIKLEDKLEDQVGLVPERLHDFKNWLEGFLDRYDGQEAWFAGYTPSGNRKFTPATLDNVSKEMKKYGSHGLDNILAAAMQRMNSTDSVRSQEDRLIDSHAELESFDKEYPEVKPLLQGLSWRLGEEEVRKALHAADPIGSLKRLGAELEEEEESMLRDWVKRYRDERPAMYFETKFERPVMFNEFAAAVVPKNTPLDVIGFLQRQGLQIEEYDAAVEDSRQEAMQRATQGNGVRFRMGNKKAGKSNAQSGSPTWRDAVHALSDWRSRTQKSTALRTRSHSDDAKVQIISERLKNLEEIIPSNGWGPDGFNAALSTALTGAEESSNVSTYQKTDIDGVPTTIRIGNHYAKVTNFKTPNNAGIVIKTSASYYRPDSSVDYLEFVYFGDKLSGDAELQRSITAGLRHYVETGSFERIPKPDILNPSGRYREIMESLGFDNKLTGLVEGNSSAAEEPVRFRRVVDADVLRQFAEGRTVKVYRTMQIIDGRLYSPMATKVGGKSTPEIRLGVPEQSEEHPEIIKETRMGDDGVEYGYVSIDKGLNKGTLGVAYNPYAHCSFTVLNDQFSSAYIRPNLVIVEVEVPISELHSGYRAPMAKDAVGEMSWHSGSVSGQLSKLGRPRRVVLTRYDRPGRIVPYKEVAEKIAEQLRGTDIAIPYNVIQPQIRLELERLGVPVSEEASGSVGEDADFGKAEYITDADIDRINARQRAAAETSVEAMAARAREIADELGIEVRIITDAAEVAALKGARRTAYGWFDAAAMKRGEAPVTVVIPNHDNVGDVERTMVHEIVAHYGLRRLIGKERFDAFLDEIHSHTQSAPRAAIDAIAADLRAEFIEAETRRRGGTLVARAAAVAAAEERADAFRREATEEYLAALAEKCGFEGLDALTEQEKSLWEKVIEKIRKFIDRIFAGKSVAKSVKLSEADLAYILHRSLQGLRAERGTMVGAAKSAAMREAAAAERRAETAPIRARAMAASTDEFDSTVAEAVASDGIVMPGLRTASVKVVEVPRHDFKGGRRAAINAAKEWIKAQAETWKREGKLKAVDSNGQTFEYGLDIKKMLSDEAINNSANTGLHLAILKELPAVIATSIEAEIHPDYLKDENGERDPKNDYTEEILMHRLYGAIENTFEGKKTVYRVKTTIKEYRDANRNAKVYSYEGIEIEPLEAPNNVLSTTEELLPLAMTSNDSMISVAKLLQGVEKSYDPGKKLLDESPDENIRFRRKPAYNSAREDYDASVRTKTVRDQYGNVARDSQDAPMRGSWLRNLREAYQDSMLSLLRLQETVERHSGKKLEGHENAYISENAMSSSVAHRSEQWKRRFFEPLMKAVAEFEDKIRAERVMDHAALTRYMMAKHGLERNAMMRAAAVAEAQAADYSAYPDPAAAQAAAVARAAARDYAGLTGLTGQKDVVAAEAVAQTIIDDFENHHGQTKIDSLWDTVRKATSSTLRTRYEAGLLSRDTYDRVKGMYQYYIPLKGWNDNTAGDLYEYEGDYMMGSAFRSAKGRASVADDPLANIMHDGLRTIQEAERNKMKQAFLNMALNHSTDVLYVSRQWYVQQPDGTWLPANPDIPEDATADEVDQIVKDFETDMERLRAQGAATNRRRNLKLGVKVLRTQTSQHIVQVKRAGEVYNVIVNGNPRAAQAVNGMLNPDSGEMSKLEKILMAIKNYLSKAFTTWNPAFVFSNVARDAGFAGLAVFAKENAAYVKRFAANYASISAGGSMAALLWREAHGKLDLTREADSYFAEFLRGGGETGFTQINTVEKAKRDMELLIREAQGGRITARGLRKLGDGIGALNRWAESLSRFAVYMTSRQLGRSVEESIWDAKEITVNFNKKGSGEYGARWFNFAYVFFNASVQAAANAAKIAVNHPGKTMALLGAVTSMGFVQGLICTVICSLFGGDPDDYWKLAEWERRSNFIIPIGCGKFLKIPIAHELRPFHGIGEIAYSVACGREDLMDGLGKAALGFTALLPIDFTGNGGNLLVNLAPSPVQPVAQVIANVNYFGKPIYRTDPYNSRNPYDENDCAWAQAYQADSPLSVSLSRSIARLFAGEPDEFGVVEYSRQAYADIPPGVIDHLVAGYTGGMGKFVMGLGNCAAMAFGDEEFDIKKIPVVSRFVTEADDRAEERADRASYRQLKSEYDDLSQYHRRLVTMPAETVEARAERVSKWLETERGRRFLDMQPFMKQINSVRARRSRLPDDPEDPHVYNRLDSLESDARQRLLSKFDSIDHRK